MILYFTLLYAFVSTSYVISSDSNTFFSSKVDIRDVLDASKHELLSSNQKELVDPFEIDYDLQNELYASNRKNWVDPYEFAMDLEVSTKFDIEEPQLNLNLSNVTTPDMSNVSSHVDLVNPIISDSVNGSASVPVIEHYKKSRNVKSNIDENSKCSINTETIFYKRLINKLLKEGAFGYYEKILKYKVNLNLEITLEEYNFLCNFGKSNKTSVTMLREASDILSKMMSYSVDPYMKKLWWTNYLPNYQTLIPYADVIVLGSCLFLLFYKLLWARMTFSYVIKLLLFMGLLTDFYCRWCTLKNEAELNMMVLLKKYGSTVPESCNPRTQSVWAYMKTLFSSVDECVEYYKLQNPNNFYSVTPLMVFSHQFGSLLSIPGSYVGQGLADFSSQILYKLPWGLNIVILPILLIFCIVVICIILSFLTSTPLNFNFFHLFSFGVGKSSRYSEQSQIGNTRIPDVIHLIHTIPPAVTQAVIAANNATPNVNTEITQIVDLRTHKRNSITDVPVSTNTIITGSGTSSDLVKFTSKKDVVVTSVVAEESNSIENVSETLLLPKQKSRVKKKKPRKDN